MNRLQSLVRRMARTRLGKAVLVLLALLILGGAVNRINLWLAPRVYFMDRTDFAKIQKAKVPKAVVDKMRKLEHRFTASPADLLKIVRETVGDADYVAHEAVFKQHIETTVFCGPNRSPRKIYEVSDSRSHPVYNTFGLEIVIPQAKLPPVTTDFEFLPGSAGVLVVGKFGDIQWFGPDWRQRLSFQIPGVYGEQGDEGALGIAVDPDFAENRYFYVAFVTDKENRSAVQRFTLSEDARQVIDSRRDVIRFPKDSSHNYHGVGAIIFMPGRLLVIHVGDPSTHSQARNNFHGKLVGVVPRAGPEGGYDPPPASLLGQLEAWWKFGSRLILASGLRAPFQASRWNDLLIVGDVGGNGPNSYERINVYSGPGMNFGWRDCRDPFLLNKFDPPTITYRRNDPGTWVDDPKHPDTVRRSVIAGPVYDKPATDRYHGALDQRLVYADFDTGFVRAAKLDAVGQVVDDVYLMSQPNITGMGVGPDGFVYGTTAFGNVGFFRFVQHKRP